MFKLENYFGFSNRFLEHWTTYAYNEPQCSDPDPSYSEKKKNLKYEFLSSYSLFLL